MKQDKKERYSNSIIPGIHTFSGTSNKEVDYIEPEIKGCIKSCSQRKVRNKDKKETYLQINPNKTTGKNILLTKYSEFLKVYNTILDGVGLNESDFNITRADMSFNSKNPEDYTLYMKLHKLLICCMAEAFHFKNCYQSYNLWSQQSLSVSIKNDDYEMENYDKDFESEGRDEVKNRLEIRSKRLKNTELKHEFMKVWIDKLEYAITQFEEVQQHFNMELEKLYKEDLAKPQKERKYYSLTSFLLQYQENIFCTSQMIDLLSRFEEVEKPESRARNFKRTHAIEYFSQLDLKFIVKEIKKKTLEYFGS